jgi:putative oxidoreductase
MSDVLITTGTLSIGLLVLRLVVGLAMAAHGAQKLFGWFGGYGIAGTGGFFEGLGFRPGPLFALAAGLSELGGGLLLALGLLGPVGSALILSVMVVAAITVHWGKPFFASTNGIEVPLLYAAAAVGLALTGPGIYSFDYALGLGSLWSPALTALVLLGGVVGALANLVVGRRALVTSG